ncbi:MAG: InlB B-repeat-containing protein [Alphaproteobacteria bacterium]|nr:InlB B-repeat-containing protein [Alphaproteobacteria bacterium]
MKKYFLTSILAISTIAPAFGADELIIGGPNTCTVDVLGVSDNNSVANTIATWAPNQYTLVPGEYLNVSETAVTETTCPAGSYCVGGEFTVETAKNSIAQCPIEYPYSADGASAENQCYTECTTGSVANATKVIGNDYFGDGVDTCSATECIAGWRVKPAVNLTDKIGEYVGSNSSFASIDNNGFFSETGKSNGQEYYGISDKNSFAVDYGAKGMITGHGRCSTQEGYGIWTDYKGTPNNPEDVTVVNTLTDETGQEGAQYCYCQLDGYKSIDGEFNSIVSAPWVFRSSNGVAEACAFGCASMCAGSLRSDDVSSLMFRTAVFNVISTMPAKCEEIVYTLKPGEYWPAGGEDPVDCPSGSYCVGGETVRWDPDKDQGISTCPVDYPYSDEKSGSENNCYRDCATDDVAGAMTVVGRNYFGDGADTCSATECVIGWHVKPGLNLIEEIGDVSGVNSSHAYIDNVGYFVSSSVDGKEYYGISDNMSFAVDYAGKGLLTGRGRCSTSAGNYIYDSVAGIYTEITVVDNLIDETGMDGAQYCYCQLDGYKSTDGELTLIETAPWLYRGSMSGCANNCASRCASGLRGIDGDVRFHIWWISVFNALGSITPATCEANTINIDWDPDNGGAHIQNMCTYDGAITLPDDPSRPGYTFTGWKLVE